MTTLIPPTSARVPRHTPPLYNRRIDMALRQRLEYYRLLPERIEHRLSQLEREWDIERVLETNASSLAFAGTLLGIFRSRGWLIIPAAVSGFLLQHALQGWCPPVPLFRRLGIRTAREIERERQALKLIRGDYGGAWAERSLDEVLQAVD